jgi:hypothetical protein
MIHNKKSIVLFLSLVLFLAGCSKKDKKIIDGFNNRPSDFEQTKNDVTVGVKFLTQTEFDKMFRATSSTGKGDLIRKHSALQLQILNNSANKIVFNRNSYDFTVMSQDQVNYMLKTNPMLMPLLIGSVWFVVVSALFSFDTGAVIGAGIGSVIALPINVINVKSENKKVESNTKALLFDSTKKITLAPGEIFSTLLVTEDKKVPEEFNVELFKASGYEKFVNFKIIR